MIRDSYSSLCVLAVPYGAFRLKEEECMEGAGCVSVGEGEKVSGNPGFSCTICLYCVYCDTL